MEEKKANALEMAAQKNEKGKKAKKTAQSRINDVYISYFSF